MLLLQELVVPIAALLRHRLLSIINNLAPVLSGRNERFADTSSRVCLWRASERMNECIDQGVVYEDLPQRRVRRRNNTNCCMHDLRMLVGDRAALQRRAATTKIVIAASYNHHDGPALHARGTFLLFKSPFVFFELNGRMMHANVEYDCVFRALWLRALRVPWRLLMVDGTLRTIRLRKDAHLRAS